MKAVTALRYIAWAYLRVKNSNGIWECFRPYGFFCEIRQQVPLTKGYEGYIAEDENGKLFIAESKSGMILGTNLDEAIQSIQIVEPLLGKSKYLVNPIQAKDFWKLPRQTEIRAVIQPIEKEYRCKS